jgi:hypothetical protein
VTTTEVEAKFCPRCGQTREVAEFSDAPSRPDGLAGWCKRCVAESNRPRNRARMRAFAALRDMYPEAFQRLYDQFLEREHHG